MEAPFYFQNLTGSMAPQPRPDGALAFALPMNPDARAIYFGDVNDVGHVVAGALESPSEVGQGQRLSVASDLVSWNDIIATLNRQGHDFTYTQVPTDLWNASSPAAPAISQSLEFYEAHTHFGPSAEPRIALARSVSTKPFADFADWARTNMPGTA